MDNSNNKDNLNDNKLDDVSGGKDGKGSGYCPYTTDRTCRLGIGFSDSETCRECGWRAW